jgi:hypothetical protein
MKTPLALLAALLCLPLSASAQAWRSYFKTPSAVKAAAACETVAPFFVGATQVSADAVGNGLCYVSIDPQSETNLVYRDYAFFSDGMLMVFNSYGEGEGPSMTSARQFYFFPRARAPHLDADAAAGTIAVVLSDGGRATFDPKTAQISALDRGTVTVSPSLDPSARGGVEISGYRGLLLDAGFRQGELPSGLPNGQSTFHGAQGQTCTVTNSEIFAYSGSDNSFKFDDAGLSAFLKTRCPALPVGF